MSEYFFDKFGFPLLLTAIFAFLSGGGTVLVGGATSRMKRVRICSVTFIFAVVEAMGWHKELTTLTGVEMLGLSFLHSPWQPHDCMEF